MLVNAAITSGSGLDPLQTASARALVATVADSRLSVGAGVLSGIAEGRSQNTDPVEESSRATIVEISPERQQADQLRAGIGAVQGEYQKLASAEAAQQEVSARVAEIQAAVREAAATSEGSVREKLLDKVTANLQAIEATAGMLQAEASGASDEASAREAAIASKVNQQKMIAEAAVYLVTSESGSRTVRVVTGGYDGALTEANSMLGDFDMHLRSLGGEVYVVPNFHRESSLLNQAMADPADAVAQSGLSGRITVNGRPYNLFGVGALSPLQVANLASVTAESDGMQEAVQSMVEGKDAQDVAREKSFSAEELADQSVMDSEAAAEEPDGVGQEKGGFAQLKQIVAPGSAVNMTENPAGALAVVDQALAESAAQGEDLSGRLREMVQAGLERVDRLLSSFAGAPDEIADEAAASEATGRVAQQLLRADMAAYSSPTLLFRNAYELLQVV